jgi:heme exporter protein B
VCIVRQTLAVLEKELRSELRRRTGLAVALLSVGSAGSIVALSTGGLTLGAEITAALLWLVYVFAIFPVLGRSFLSEEERQTRLLLWTLAPPSAIYWGKLLTAFLTSALNNALATLVLGLFGIGLPARGVTVVLLLLAAAGLSAVATLLSALVAAVQHRGLLLPILGFPLLIPVLLPGIAATQLLLAGAAERELFPSFALMTAYAGIVSILGWWLFEWVWQE